MKTNYRNIISQISIVCLLCNAIEALAVERYVNVNNPAPAAPYLTWATAANSIQAAIDAASSGDLITVTNGVYQTGTGEVSFWPGGTTRVSITKPLLLRSVNGPGVTFVDGGGAIRCVALASGAVLSGFTLTNGLATNGNHYGYGGGAVGENFFSRVTNCIITGNSSFSHGGGAAHCGLDNCVVSNNYSGQSGGGTASCSVNNSTIVYNVARVVGGGGDNLAMTNCFISGNTAWSGGGAGAATSYAPPVSSYFVNCIFVNNRATGTNGTGGGVYGNYGWLYNCNFTNNSASAGGGASGGRLYDCAMVGNYATNGGGGAAFSTLERCLVLGNYAKKGGGIFGGFIEGLTTPYNHSASTYRCVVAGNSSTIAGGGIYGNGWHQFAVITNNFAQDGGGFASDDSYISTTEFDTCQFSGNVATNRGGAVYGFAPLDSCTVAGNSAGNEGGGICGTTNDGPSVNRSIIYHNSAPLSPNYDINFFVADSCTTPMPVIGYNNFTNDPAFANLSAGNYRLISNSPCINYFYYPNPSYDVDLDGNPRVMGAANDLGAYEFQTPGSRISYLWLQQYGLPTDGSADRADTDGDHFDNWHEWVAHTSPLNATSLLKVLQVVPNGDSSTVIWLSVPDVAYFVERGTSLTANPAFTYVSTVYGSPGTNVTSFVDSSATGSGPFFYRLRVGQ